jgi:hypothetical protein
MKHPQQFIWGALSSQKACKTANLLCHSTAPAAWKESSPSLGICSLLKVVPVASPQKPAPVLPEKRSKVSQRIKVCRAGVGKKKPASG